MITTKLLFVVIATAAWLLSPWPLWVILAEGDKELAICMTVFVLLIFVGIASIL